MKEFILKLKIIKNRLRSTLYQKRLTPLMLISIEKDISKNINKEDIIILLNNFFLIAHRYLKKNNLQRLIFKKQTLSSINFEVFLFEI